MDPFVVARARAEVETLWRRYHVDLVWGRAGESGRHPPPDLSVEVLDDGFRAAGPERRVAIARITFENGVPSNRIEISRASAEALLATATWAGGNRSLDDAPSRLRAEALGRIVGRALAHEIGHYLLGSPSHADRGLMRAVIDREYLLSASTSSLVLVDADLRLLRTAHVARCERAR